MKVKIGRPRKGLKVSEVTSIRLEPSDKKDLIRRFGSIQRWVDWLLNKDAASLGSPDETAT